MLTKTEKQKLRKNLPHGYAKKVVDILNTKELFNTNGDSYSEASVRRVLADRENLDIEEALLELYEKVKVRKKTIKEKAKKALETT